MDPHLILTCAATGAVAGVACNWLALGATRRQLPAIVAANADKIGQAIQNEARPAERLRSYLQSQSAKDAFRSGLAQGLGAVNGDLKIKTRDGKYEYVSLDRLSEYLAEHMTQRLLSDAMEQRLASWVNALYRGNYNSRLRDLLPGFVLGALDGWFQFVGNLPANNTDLVDKLFTKLGTDQRKLREALGPDTVDNLLALYDEGTLFVRDKGLPLIDSPKVHSRIAEAWSWALAKIRAKGRWFVAWVAERKFGTPDAARKWLAESKNRAELRAMAHDYLTGTVEGDMRKYFKTHMRDLEGQKVADLFDKIPAELRRDTQAFLKKTLAKPELRSIIVATLCKESETLLNGTVGFYMDKVGGWRKPGEPVDKAIDRLCHALFAALRDPETRAVIKGFVSRIFSGFVESFAAEVSQAPDHDKLTVVADAIHARVAESLAPGLEQALAKVDVAGQSGEAIRLFARDTLPDLLAAGPAQEFVGYLTLYGAIPGALVGALGAIIAG